MFEKEVFILPDKNVVPDDKLIFSIIGGRKKQWQSIMNYVSANYKGSSGVWNYYNDGKQWLFKMVQKKKTLFWIAILDGTFRITFYFGDKAEPVILNSDLPEAVKEGFKNTKRYGKIRAISNRIEEVPDIETIYKLINIKAKI